MAVPLVDPGRIVLVVDDERVVLQLIERALTSAGYQVLVATNGLEAIALSVELSRPPIALITDLRMEPIDGANLARLIREQWPGIPLLFMSAHSPSVEVGQLPGPLLLKPFYAAQLLRALTAVIGRADASRDPSP